MWDNLQILALAPVFNIQLVVNGVLIGAVFALAAYGLALVWGVTNVENLAQGDFVMMGGYLAYTMTQWGLHPIAALVPVCLFMFGFGWIVYKLVISRVIQRDLFTSLLATFGLAIVMQQSMNLIFGPEVRTADAGFETREFFDGLVTVTDTRIISFALCALLAVGMVLFMKRSRMGQAIRATAQDARAARVMGVDTEKVYAFTFSINAAICGAAGVLISMIWVLQPFYGIAYSVRAFVIVTAAGLGNLFLVALALLIGTPFFVFFGRLSDRIGRKRIMVTGCLLAALTFWLSRLVEKDRPRQPLRHDPDYIVDRFEVRRFDANGKLQHTLVGERLVHYPDDDTTVVTTPRLTYHRGAATELRAGSAFVGRDGKEIDLVENVHIVRHSASGDIPPTEVTTRTLKVFPDEERAIGRDAVTIMRGQSVLRGSGMEIDNRTGVSVLHGRVKGTFHSSRTE